MVSKELIDLVNSGDAVAIVGCGVSIEAGIPSWGELFARVADTFGDEGVDTNAARAIAASGDLPAAFEKLAGDRSLQHVHEAVRKIVATTSKAGRHHERLADWPFRLYVTTNYDHLLEKARTAKHRLVPVGNTGAELRKLDGGPRDVVWHMHGGCDLPTDVSQLIVTKGDYDNLYPDSNQVQTLRAIARIYRCVYVGFGFNDKDLLHILRAVGRLAHAGRPNFAFLACDGDPTAFVEQQKHIRAEFNVEVIPYRIHGVNHSELHRRLDGHGAFVLRRSVSPGPVASGSPDYEPIASSLRVQSSLDLAELSVVEPSLRKTLVGASMLAKIREKPSLAEADLIKLATGMGMSEMDAQACLEVLRSRGLVTVGEFVGLTIEYDSKTDASRARLELVRDRFLASMKGRLDDSSPPAGGTAGVIDMVARFLEELCRERGLGVAQNLASSDKTVAARRTVALLQQLPERLKGCASYGDALMAINLTSDVLTAPTPAESAFLGMLCQGYFGQHLVGATVNLSKVDLDLIAGTCYVLDASFLICLLAEGTEVQEFASRLVGDLKKLGAILTTSDLLVDEVMEHSNWALRLVGKHGEDSVDVLDALRGRSGYRANQFLKGYFLGSTTDVSFGAYITRLIGRPTAGKLLPEDVVRTLTKLGIDVVEFSKWENFESDQYPERARLQEEIGERRRERKTYKHDRQTRAEAEVAIIVDSIRRGRLQPPGRRSTDAFFLSSTRVVDKLPGLDRRISLLPEGLAQWVWSRHASSERYSELVFEQLLWELTQEGLEFVNRSALLRKFGGVVQVGREGVDAAVRERREFLVDRYGPDPAAAFSDVDPLDLPDIARDMDKEALARMEDRVAEARRKEMEARDEARGVAKLSQKERDELVRLRGQQKARHNKAEKARRAAASRPGSKKGRH
jgi:hypothetical protein